MISQTSYSRVKSLFGKAILTILVSGSVSAVQAQSRDEPITTPNKTTVNYLGIQDEMYLFDVKYANLQGNKFILQIKENSGNILFKEIYTDRAFTKKFKIAKDLEGKLNFVIRDLKGNSTETFEVNTSTHVLNDVVVSKLN